MKAIILSIGDELVLGQTVDTNSAWLSQQLAAVGCDIAGHATVPDDQAAIESAIGQSVGCCDFLLISGGIGPTEDDLTRQALAATMDTELELNESWLARLIEFFKSRGREMPEINKIQAMIPQGAQMIENTAGTAAGIDAVVKWPPLRLGGSFNADVSDASMERMFGRDDIWSGDPKHAEAAELIRRRRSQKGPTRTFVMPGVPKEMKLMFTKDVLPHIAKSGGGAVILSRTLHTFGLGESSIAERLGELMNRRRNPSVGTTVSGGIVSLRINARFLSLDEAQRQLEETAIACRTALGDLIFGQDDETLSMVVAGLLWKSEKTKTVTTAESCTGGLLAKMLTDLPGSSAYFTQGWVTYSNQAKYERLGVSMEVLNLNGAVSEPVVELMAKNARRLARADFALSISGIAGPDGGSAAKPVGTVCIALASPDPADKQIAAVQKRTFVFSGDREMIRDRSAKMALTMLRFHLLGKKIPF